LTHDKLNQIFNYIYEFESLDLKNIYLVHPKVENQPKDKAKNREKKKSINRIERGVIKS
jgi:5-methylcytosine-specific restriction endonuclease McrBC regulatory subunit McrC